MRLSKSQLNAFAITFNLARNEWQIATVKRKQFSGYCHPIPLTKYYKLFSSKCRPCVQAAFEIFFERVKRGHSTAHSSEVSGWRPRYKNDVRSIISPSGQSLEEVMKSLTAIYEDNKENIHKVRKHIFTKTEENTVSTVIQTELVWKSDVMRQVFEDVAVSALEGPKESSPKSGEWVRVK